MTAPYNATPTDLDIAERFGMSDEAATNLLEFIWPGLVREGVLYEDVVIDGLSDEGVELNAKQINELIDALIEARRAQQASTPVPEGAVRLTAAFDELESMHIMARQDFSCCGTCAPGDIRNEMDEYPAPWRGYVYFHMQDAESLIESGGTYIGYGIVPSAFISEEEWNRYDEQALDVWYDKTTVEFMKREVLPVFAKHGIDVEWNGNFAQRIYLRNVDYANTAPADKEI